MRRTILLVVSTALLAAGPAVAAPPAGAEVAYAESYGEGLRLYAEGHYDRAVKHLFAAYALDPAPMPMALIIRSYDFMGHCSAANRQLEVFGQVFPEVEPPGLQRCAEPARLTIACHPRDTDVLVDGLITTRCGATIALPAGEHTLTATALGAEKTLQLDAGLQASVTLELTPEKWIDHNARTALAGHLRVDRLPTDAGTRYTVVQGSDGLYQIWAHGDPSQQGDSPVEPRIIRICDRHEAFHPLEKTCVPLPNDGIHIEKIEE